MVVVRAYTGRTATQVRHPGPPPRSATQVRQPGPPTRSANQVHQVAPPSETAELRRLVRERLLPVTTSLEWQSADRPVEACRSVAAQARTATGDTANEVRQVGPPTDTAKLLRRSESANQRAPTAGDHLPRPATCRTSHRTYRSVAPQTRTATGDTANEVRQVGPPTDTAKLLRRSESANQRAPTADDHLPRPATCRTSHRSLPISRASNPHRHWRHRQRGPPSWSANRHRQVASPVRERQPESANRR
jgi:hypothetical protein